ncbi:conserved hypothetical protein [Flavobacterium sp. 9AF]|uniref:hypothetical protein n=1 Tax=Flavobacterium sp. 9AF TaxID=2653142 RepID=UPI0012F3EE52|nr:hypothetical protein [Flavobacterium sp. 9AF]VXB47158.1 conserved hypothetical protein [Flavobacterium sp. 9AF]
MRLLYIILFFINSVYLQSQSLQLNINGKTNKEQKVIDSISYTKKHITVSSIIDEVKKIDSILIRIGYINHTITKQEKINDSTFLYQYHLGNLIKKTIITTRNINAEYKNLLSIQKDTLSIPFFTTENCITNKLKELEKKGYPLAKISLTNHQIKDNVLYCDLHFELDSKRMADEIIILGYEKFPKNIKIQLNKYIKNKTFNQNLISKINNQINSLNYVKQLKYPEILFTENSTKIFTYITKTKSNKFDGFIGFANNKEEKLVFNGYLDLLLINTLNSGEKIKFFWKNNGNQETLFSIENELPYLFKTKLGIQSELNIFKQDSSFQNTKLNLNLSYHFSFNQKALVGIQKTTSVDIQNINSNNLQNFQNVFYTFGYEYNEKNNINQFNEQKTRFDFKSGLGYRTNKTENNTQYFGQIEASRLIELNDKNNILIKSNTYYLNSDNYLTNELYRFGGINSIRGFRENSLQTNFFSGIMTEYQYSTSPNLQLYSVLDYAYTQDKTILKNNKLLGTGLGIKLLTNNGLLQIIYSNGSLNNQKIKLSNSVIQISFKAIF